MRTTKDPETRKAEILDTAETLFITKGYAQTTIMDILNAVGIAKGTFYYHFKSKEEVMDAVIMRIVDADVAAAKKIICNSKLSAAEKLFQALFAQKPIAKSSKDKMISQFRQPSNAEMHQKSLVLSIQHMAPVLAQAVEQGIQEKTMYAEYPQETVELLLAAAQIVFDDALFHWETEAVKKKAEAFVKMMESALGAKKDAFRTMVQILL